MQPFKQVSVLGFNVYSDDLDRIPIHSTKSRVINTISPNSYGICIENKCLDKALRASDYLVLDGVYFSVASLLLHGKNIKRNQGPDVFHHFMRRLNDISGKVFFLGSSDETLQLIKANAKKYYPNTSVFLFSPSYSSQFNDEENKIILDEINLVKPDILFVGMTCPKQEIWSIQNRYMINNVLIISIGNVFDWFAGTQKSIHPIWFHLRLGWLIRIILRPEIFKRNIGNQMRFFKDVLSYFFGLKSLPSNFGSNN